MFLSTDEAVERLQEHVEQLRGSLSALSNPEAATQIFEVATGWVENEGTAWIAMKQQKAEQTIEALHDFIATHDRIFKEGKGFTRLCDLVGVDAEATRTALRQEMVEPLLKGSLFDINLFKYREMAQALVERMRSVAH